MPPEPAKINVIESEFSSEQAIAGAFVNEPRYTFTENQGESLAVQGGEDVKAIIPTVKTGLIDRWRFRDVQPLLPTS